MLNYGNAIQIAEFTGNASDDELLLLASYLKKFKNVENVRQIDKRYWRKSLNYNKISRDNGSF
ncbi:MAG: hypothetical protein K0S24_4255 [Sphingobacterium sp.]|jgi:RNA polymerase II subunit A small phosphatase-like protein|nr:hypothetical protein [Sphingobacterium sp.]